MQKKLWIILAMVLVVPGLMVTVSCQKKVVAVEKPAPAPVAVEEEKEVVVVTPPAKMDDYIMQEDIHFEFDKSTLTPAAQDNLMKKAEWMRSNADATVTIEGHADDRGTNEYNLALGERRAESSKNFLVDLGIAPSRMTTISYGEERPLCPQQTEECWAKNRRDHFVIN